LPGVGVENFVNRPCRFDLALVYPNRLVAELPARFEAMRYQHEDAGFGQARRTVASVTPIFSAIATLEA
jgi:hypothetical protein